MGFDETARLVWQTRNPPLAILVAGRITEMMSSALPTEQRAPFLALARAVDAWWPRRTPKPAEIYEQEFEACLDLYGSTTSAKPMQPTLHSAHVLMAAVLRAAPRSLPVSDFGELREDDFVKLLRQGAKVGRLPLAQLNARLQLLLEHMRDPWPDVVARADRMNWGLSAPWGALDKRVRNLAAVADLGAELSWVEVGGQRALSLRLDSTRRTAVLNDDEISAFASVIPAAAS